MLAPSVCSSKWVISVTFQECFLELCSCFAFLLQGFLFSGCSIFFFFAYFKYFSLSLESFKSFLHFFLIKMFFLSFHQLVLWRYYPLCWFAFVFFLFYNSFLKLFFLCFKSLAHFFFEFWFLLFFHVLHHFLNVM